MNQKIKQPWQSYISLITFLVEFPADGVYDFHAR